MEPEFSESELEGVTVDMHRLTLGKATILVAMDGVLLSTEEWNAEGAADDCLAIVPLKAMRVGLQGVAVENDRGAERICPALLRR